MLKTLTVENFALIDALTVEFGGGLNILTGETGAGKSILVDALGAVLGNRIGASQIRKGADFLRVTATFTSDEGNFVIERQISRTGRSSIAINGESATISQLKKFAEELLDVHGQNKQLELLREEKIYELLDADETISASKENFRQLFRDLSAQKQILAKKLSLQSENSQRLEFLRWQEREISAAKLQPDEDEQIRAEIHKLSHAEKISERIQESIWLLYDADDDILSNLSRVKKNLSEVARYDDKLAEVQKFLDDAEVYLREAAYEIRAYGNNFEFSPEELNRLQERENEIFKLKQKYGASVNEILSKLQKIRDDISEAETLDFDIAELRKNVAEASASTKVAAEKLLKLRQAAAKTLGAALETQIRRLGMSQAQFEIVVTPTEKFSEGGGDTAQINFSANVGEEKFSLAQVVSGGELSRIALAVKAVAAENSSATLVFDEIDAGIGGVTAKTVAECISTIAKHRQVLCITHLAQIASMADVHLLISKAQVGGRTVTRVEKLDEAGRIAEISRMASGKESEKSVANACEMLASAEVFKRRLLA